MNLHLTEKMNIQVALYMLNYGNKDALKESAEDFLTGWIQDCFCQIKAQNGKDEGFWVPANPLKVDKNWSVE